MDHLRHSSHPLGPRAGYELHDGWIHPHSSRDRGRGSHHQLDPGPKSRLTRVSQGGAPVRRGPSLRNRYRFGAVLLDLDGCLIDSNDAHARALEPQPRSLRPYGSAPAGSIRDREGRAGAPARFPGTCGTPLSRQRHASCCGARPGAGGAGSRRCTWSCEGSVPRMRRPTRSEAGARRARSAS